MIAVTPLASRICGRVKVDYLEKGPAGSGFSLISERPLPGTGGGCGGSCSSNDCPNSSEK